MLPASFSQHTQWQLEGSWIWGRGRFRLLNYHHNKTILNTYDLSDSAVARGRGEEWERVGGGGGGGGREKRGEGDRGRVGERSWNVGGVGMGRNHSCVCGSLYAWHDDFPEQLLHKVHVGVHIAHDHTEQSCWLCFGFHCVCVRVCVCACVCVCVRVCVCMCHY